MKITAHVSGVHGLKRSQADILLRNPDLLAQWKHQNGYTDKAGQCRVCLTTISKNRFKRHVRECMALQGLQSPTSTEDAESATAPDITPQVLQPTSPIEYVTVQQPVIPSDTTAIKTCVTDMTMQLPDNECLTIFDAANANREPVVEPPQFRPKPDPTELEISGLKNEVIALKYQVSALQQQLRGSFADYNLLYANFRMYNMHLADNLRADSWARHY